MPCGKSNKTLFKLVASSTWFLVGPNQGFSKPKSVGLPFDTTYPTQAENPDSHKYVETNGQIFLSALCVSSGN